MEEEGSWLWEEQTDALHWGVGEDTEDWVLVYCSSGVLGSVVTCTLSDLCWLDPGLG